MVLSIAESLYRQYFPSQYLVHILATSLVTVFVWAYAQGRRTNRERDLHSRVFIVTGGFTSTGLVLLQNLAERGAHIIALTSADPESPPISTTLIDILRQSTNNQQIFAEHCSLSSPSSIHAFCTKFLTTKSSSTSSEQRVDVLLFMHEYQHVGGSKQDDEKRRKESSLATFLMTTLLLPALLIAPVERDIRIINVVNPFYAAAAKTPLLSISPTSPRSPFIAEGRRSLQTVILTRHLQRILDALPSAQVPKTEQSATSVPVVSAKSQKSNIVAVSVSPGFSRTDTISLILGSETSMISLLAYLILQPILRIFTKSPYSAIQTILHAIFLPTPFKIRSSTADATTSEKKPAPTKLSPEEILKPGALYADCAVLRLALPVMVEEEDRDSSKNGDKGKKKEMEGLELPNDGEYGDEVAGRKVWESLETQLKDWEQEEKERLEKEGKVEDDKTS